MHIPQRSSRLEVFDVGADTDKPGTISQLDDSGCWGRRWGRGFVGDEGRFIIGWWLKTPAVEEGIGGEDDNMMDEFVPAGDNGPGVEDDDILDL